MTQVGEQKPVLFAVLNWGMGHASRSVPLIRAFQEKGISVILAADGAAADLLQAEFPDQTIHELPSYNVRYQTRNIYWNVLRSLVTILISIWAEHQWLRAFVRKQPLRAIISDNRYGIRLSGIPSILITHQLRFFGPWAWANRIGQLAVRWWSRKYTEIWVPDWEGANALSGGMASWTFTRPPILYLGPLSRFGILSKPSAAPKVDIIAILSGPEPQRTYLERLISNQLTTIPGKHVLIRGTKQSPPPGLKHPNITCYDLLAAEELQVLVSHSIMQISRSGYSTVMDLTYSGIPALMIPTPGQIEQEFLADHLRGKGPWIFHTQDKLDIQTAYYSRAFWADIPSKRPDGKEAERAVTSFLQRLATIEARSVNPFLPEPPL
ncbi:MAG: hypothetical protein K9I85_08000 [Saprospiraceae bacterium]|nr:hypothetical protein [Saprospiraceae bacterium]